jgi:hypothetical protein
MSDAERGVEQAMVEAPAVDQPTRFHGKRLRSFSKAWILVAAVVAAGTLAGAAAGVVPFSAATGIQVRGSDPNAQAIGTGQAIALGASDDVSAGVNLTQGIPFAPGYESWRAGTIAFQTSLGAGAPPGHAYITSSALRWQVAESAVCSWANYYVASEAAGNAAAAATAAAQIATAPSWSAITGLSYPSGLPSVVAAVGAGDANLVQALIDTGQVGGATCTALGAFPPVGMSPADRATKLAAASQVGHREIATDAVAQGLGIR